MTSRLITTILLVLAPVPGIAADPAVTLAAWNIEHLAANDARGCRPRDTAEYDAIRIYLNRANADVVAFQEVEDLQRGKEGVPRFGL